MGNFQVRYRLTRLGRAAIKQRDPCAHPLEHIEHAGATSTNADAAEKDARLGNDRRRDDQKRRRRDIAWHFDLVELQSFDRVDHDATTRGVNGCAGCTQHAFGVIACRRCFDDRGRPVRAKSRQQQGRLDLRGGDLHHVLHPDQLLTTLHDNRRTPSRRLDAGTHYAQRRSNALHRARTNRGIAVEREDSAWLHREDATQQPHQRARVLHVDCSDRRLQARQAYAMHGQATSAVVIHLDAKSADSFERCARIGRIAPALNLDGAVAECANQERAVTDRLVAIDDKLANQRTRAQNLPRRVHSAPP